MSAAAVSNGPALVRTADAVLDESAPTTSQPALAQLRVQLLQRSSADLGDRHVAECWLQVQAGVGLVAGDRALIRVVHLQPSVDRRAEGLVRRRCALSSRSVSSRRSVRSASSRLGAASTRSLRRPVTGSVPA